jgi:hypothetical protein
MEGVFEGEPEWTARKKEKIGIVPEVKRKA